MPPRPSVPKSGSDLARASSGAAPDHARPPRLTLARAEGLHVWDRDGNRYLDGTSGAFCVQLGYSRPDLVRALTEGASRLPHAKPSAFDSEDAAAYERELLHAAGPPYVKVVLTSSGSEAIDVALKMAHRYQAACGHPDRTRMAYLSGHYHGQTLGALGVTGLESRRAPFQALVGSSRAGPAAYCRRCFRGLVYPGCGLACAEAALAADSAGSPLAAIILETIPAAGLGAPVPPAGYLERIRERSDALGALWIADEVLTGFGRTGSLFAFSRWGAVRPDLVLFGKGAGAGFAPLAGVLASERVARALETDGFRHVQTHGGNPVAAAVGRRVLQALHAETICERVREREDAAGNTLRRSLVDVPQVWDVRGLGFLWGVELATDRATGSPLRRDQRVAERVADGCRQRGVLVHAGSGAVDGIAADFILIAPPLIAELDVFAEIAAILADSIRDAA